MSSPFTFALFLFCFVSSVFFACKGWLIRFSGRGGVCSQALRTYFFRANSLCKIFFLDALRLQEFFLTRP